jgi:hypothetical protein
MFRSARRPIVYPQAEHARFAATIAAAWGNESFGRPSLPFDSFVRGVALHDRGYGELDSDDPFAASPAQLLEFKRRNFAPRGDDPIVDLVVALHTHRLTSSRPSTDLVAKGALSEMEAALPGLRAAAGVSEAEARAADDITNLCDRIAVDFCLEEPSSGGVEIVPTLGAAPSEVRYTFDGQMVVTLSPWPLGVAWLAGVVVAFRAERYPDELDSVISLFRLDPA